MNTPTVRMAVRYVEYVSVQIVATELPSGVLTSTERDDRRHECQRCGSVTWSDVDYSGCSDCREEAD